MKAPGDTLRMPTRPGNGALKLERCARNLEIRRRFVDGLLRHVARARKLLGPIVVGSSEVITSLRIGDLGLCKRIIQLDQQVARIDGAALGEADLGDPPGDLGGDLHRLVGLQAADSANISAVRGTTRYGDFHGDGALGAFAEPSSGRLRGATLLRHCDLGRLARR